MSESTDTELASEYSARIAQDLELNAEKQDRLATEIAALEEQLRAVRENRVVLERLQQALTPQATATAPAHVPATASASGTAEPAEATDAVEAAVPHPRTESAAKRRASAKPSPKQPKPSLKQPKPGLKETKPSLVEAVHTYLAQQREPVSASDVAEAIRAAQPGRAIKTTVIRTTLENLVAKNRARRTRQGRAVSYTLSASQEPQAPEADADAEV
ncbi:BlaI/MecI/CopY family transcriptional regulator [Streptomyces shenzhenensis]|uniref:BlaI/MecI/CopY family transcriptional regulator n=1 Tax=Streptomyces shenzhenensis TaxID=943815 RepID=UPI0015F0FAFD|nr:BlaI/MecI/CopY family transcriptional regulator [Streptomyces shenzhenensis]